MSNLYVCKEYENMYSEGFEIVRSIEEHNKIIYNQALDDAINEIINVKSEVAEKEPYDAHLFTVLVRRQNEIIDLIQKLKVGGEND